MELLAQLLSLGDKSICLRHAKNRIRLIVLENVISDEHIINSACLGDSFQASTRLSQLPLLLEKSDLAGHGSFFHFQNNLIEREVYSPFRSKESASSENPWDVG
jgi:hypothetical protein